MKNAGTFTGNYFRIFGYASLVCMLVAMLYNHFININLSFILFIWAGSELAKHNPKARTWVMRLCLICMLALITTCCYVHFMAIEKISVDLFGILLDDIQAWLFYTTLCIFFVACLVPFIILLGSKARHEFSAADPSASLEHNDEDA